MVNSDDSIYKKESILEKWDDIRQAVADNCVNMIDQFAVSKSFLHRFTNGVAYIFATPYAEVNKDSYDAIKMGFRKSIKEICDIECDVCFWEYIDGWCDYDRQINEELEKLSNDADWTTASEFILDFAHRYFPDMIIEYEDIPEVSREIFEDLTCTLEWDSESFMVLQIKFTNGTAPDYLLFSRDCIFMFSIASRDGDGSIQYNLYLYPYANLSAFQFKRRSSPPAFVDWERILKFDTSQNDDGELFDQILYNEYLLDDEILDDGSKIGFLISYLEGYNEKGVGSALMQLIYKMTRLK